jgi:serine/threonine-protein kinase
MTTESTKSSERDRRLDEVLAEYIRAAEAGRAPDHEEFLARHPDLTAELRTFLANRQLIERLAKPLRAAAPSGPYLGKLRYFGDYELLQEIARGGMGVVYKARQVSLDRIVALKMILAGPLASPSDVQRFLTEARAAAELSHSHIVPIHEVGEHEGQHYFSMKLIEGGSLAEHLPRLTRDPRAAAQLMVKVARAIHFAHQRGILHRDLKPANILLDAEGQPYVSDFGLAKRVESDTKLTETGEVVGTARYMAPEQALGQTKRLTTAVDVYSLGVILYELLTGVPPFQGETVWEILRQVQEQEPRQPRSLNRRVDQDLATICLKCLEKEPQRRYGSAEALADDLERWLARKPVKARPVGSIARLWRWTRRHPQQAALLAIMALLLLMALRSGYAWELRVSNAKDAKKLARSVDAELKRVEWAVLGIAGQEELRHCFARHKSNEDLAASLVKFLGKNEQDFNRWWRGRKPLVNLFIINPEGFLIADSSPMSRSVGMNFKQWDYYVKLVKEPPADKEAVYSSPVFKSQQDGFFKFAVITRIWDGAKILGLLAATIPTDSEMVALDMQEEAEGALLACPMDWTYTDEKVVPRELRHDFIAVLHRDYRSPGVDPIWVTDHKLGTLRGFANNRWRVQATDRFPGNGGFVDYARVGDSHFVVVVEQPYPWPINLLLNRTVWYTCTVFLVVLGAGAGVWSGIQRAWRLRERRRQGVIG